MHTARQYIKSELYQVSHPIKYGGDDLMYIKQRQEQFSKAYIHAVASVAGYTTYNFDVDDDSIDLGIAGRGSGGTIRSPRLEMQLKCAYKHNVFNKSDLSYDISIKNYDDLRDPNCAVPRILVVVVIPKEIQDWIYQPSEEELIIRHCGYWVSLRGNPSTSNKETISISLPQKNLFTVPALKDLMQLIGGGGTP